MTATRLREELLGATGSPSERFVSRDPGDFPEPNRSQEDWRFSPLPRLRGLFAGDPSDHCLAWDVTWPEGVDYTEVGLDDPRVAGAPLPVDRLAALAQRRAGGAAVITLRPGLVLADPLIVRLTGDSLHEIVWGRIVFDIGAQAEATIVVVHRGGATYAGETSHLVGDGAHVTFVHLYDWAPGTVHTEHVGARVGRDASYRQVAVALGGDVVRIAPTVEYAGPGARAELLGVSFAGDAQHFESRLFVDHNQPNCSSNVLYKNALMGVSARTVWIGDVRIRPAATGTDTYEMNRNLLLSEGARADSVPNLEIETGNIAGAGHASTTGRFDDLQLFYLQARGIPEDEARRLVVRGFFADVVERIGVPELEQQIMTDIEARLGFVPELEFDQ